MTTLQSFYRAMLLFVLFSLIYNRAYSKPPSEGIRLTTLILKIDNYIGRQKLLLDSTQYQNSFGQKFKISRFNYFISNIVFTMKNGKEYAIPQDSSYFLIKQSDSLTGTIRLNVPEGKYKSFRFTLGVDSLRSTMDLAERKGTLDPAGGMNEGMYWSWNSGYIFFKMEGESPAIPLDKTGRPKFRFHIGGFGGYNKPSLNNIKVVSLNLNKLKTSLKRESQINIKTDILKVIDGKTKIDLAKNASVMFGNFSAIVAENYKEMFSLISVSQK